MFLTSISFSSSTIGISSAGGFPLSGSTGGTTLPAARGPSCILSATISVRERGFPWPSCQLLVLIFPSIIAKAPFFKYWEAISASRPKRTILWNSTCSCFWPDLSTKTRLVANPKEQTCWPEGRAFSSGSRVNLPIKIALFKFTPLEVCLYIADS